MRAVPADLLVLCQLVCVAYCVRRFGWERSGVDAPADDALIVVDLPATDAASDDASPKPRKRRRWSWSKALPFVAAASPAHWASAGDSIESHGLLGPARVFEALPSEAGALARQISRKPSLPMNLNIRGGAFHVAAAAVDEHEDTTDQELEGESGGPSDPAVDTNFAFADAGPEARWFSDPMSATESMELLRQGGLWRTTMNNENVRQIWEFEFVLKDGLHVDISYYDLPSAGDKAGSELVMLTPTILLGRFLGFTGSDGVYRYRFTHVGHDLRVDISYPADAPAEGTTVIFASPVTKHEFSAATPPSASPTPEMQEKIKRNLRRLVWEGDEDVPAESFEQMRQIIEEVQMPGEWIGLLEAGGAEEPIDWHFKFFVEESSVICEIEAGDSVFQISGFALLKPRFDGEDFVGLSGEGHTLTMSRGGKVDTAGSAMYYLFKMVNGRLMVEIDYVEQKGVKLRFKTFLVNRVRQTSR